MDRRKRIRGIGDLWTTHPELANQLVDKEQGYATSHASEMKLDWICPNCGSVIKDRRVCYVVVNGFACKKCSDGVSYPNKFMYNVLRQLNISFETEKRFDWCKFYYKNKIRTGVYDFYFEMDNNKYIIEMDGGMHFINNTMSGLSKQDSKYIDEQKSLLADQNGFEIIRILADKSNSDYISKNILSSKLSSILNLSDIDWIECDKKSLSSLVIKVAEMWNKGFSVKEIANEFNLYKDTIIRYLKKANKHNFCNYNPKLQMQLNAKNNASKHTKSVICLTTGVIYNSIVEATRMNGANRSHISDCCNGKRKSSGKLKDGTKLKWAYVKKEDLK
jgi:very-short-patch-repair endonuclease/predicted RNA-binding Zn-ribbon protein involved in translation (DUF1610 family)